MYYYELAETKFQDRRVCDLNFPITKVAEFYTICNFSRVEILGKVELITQCIELNFVMHIENYTVLMRSWLIGSPPIYELIAWSID